MKTASRVLSKIYIAGHTGLVGSALVRYFSADRSVQLIVADRSELDLTQQQAVASFLARHRPGIVIIAAGRVGGIQANSRYPAEFVYQNLMIETNLIHAAWKTGVKKLLNFGSSCVYPKECPQPMTPNLLMTGKIEETNEPYAIAKLAGMSLCASYNRQYGTGYINAIPSNLYGPGDSFDLERCHVVSALIHKFHEAKISGRDEVVLWGSGRVLRDFLFVDDFAAACDRVLEKYDSPEPINIGAETPYTIHDLANLVAAIVGFKGVVRWDLSKPDGAPQRMLEAGVVKRLGWAPKTDLKSGLQKTYSWFLEHRQTSETGDKKCVSL